MNRENKRKTFQKGYYKTHPCGDAFTCKACGWPVGPEGAGSGHQPLPQLSHQPPPGRGARGPGSGLRRADGACGGLGPEGR